MRNENAVPMPGVTESKPHELDSWRFVTVVIGVLLLIGLNSFTRPSDLTLDNEYRKAEKWPTLSDVRSNSVGESAHRFTQAFDDRYALRDWLNYLRHII